MVFNMKGADDTAIEVSLPPHHVLYGSTIYFAGTGASLIPLCSPPVLVTSKAHNAEGREGHSLVVEFERNGRNYSLTIGAEQLHDNPRKLLQMLSAKGIDIAPANGKQFINYLFEASKLPELPITLLLRRNGFVRDDLVFVCKDKVFQVDSDSRRFLVQPPNQQFAKGIYSSGTFEDYAEKLLSQLTSEPLKFALMAALAAPLSDLIGMEGGGFHYCGASGCGKSTLLQVGASVFGSGADPCDGTSETSINSWNRSTNSFDSVLPLHSGMGHFFDELGARRDRSLGTALYGLLSGKPKDRMQGDLSLSDQETSSVFVFSSGEISVLQKVAQEGETIKAGISARLASIPLEPSDLVEEGESTLDTAKRMTEIKQLCSEYFGVLGPEYIELFINSEIFEGSSEKAQDFVRNIVEEVNERFQNLPKNAVQMRAMKRFSLVLAAGIIARNMGLLGWGEDEMESSVRFMIERWLQAFDQTKTDIDRAIDGLRDYLRQQYHAFAEFGDHSHRGTVSGYKHNGLILLLPQTFDRLCLDCQPIQVLKELKKLGFLKHEEDKLKWRTSIPIAPGRQRYVAIDQRFLEQD
ncbi:DUF927 domain-containing protein [Vibrio vulnificus]|uniref:DUF927 domain-containing protein n=1 Tax=Vibrio vulnificus TaxID=672 RepID=UPI00307E6004